MRKVCLSILSFVFVAALLSGCQQKETPVYCNVIPANASFVAVFNPQTLKDKAGMDEKSQEQLVAMMPGAVAGVFTPDGQGMGIDWESDVFFFGIPELIGGSALIRVADAAELTKTFKELEAGGELSFIEETLEYTVCRKNDVVFAYNRDVLLAMAGDGDVKEAAVNLLLRKSEENITGKEGFQQMMDKKNDISLLLSIDKIKEMAQAFNPQLYGMPSFSADVIMHLGFETGKISWSTAYHSADTAFHAWIGRQASYISPINNRFMPSFPASTLLYSAANVNGEALWKMMEEHQVDLEVNNLPKDAEKFIDAFKKIFATLQGEMAFGIAGVSETGMPSVLIHAEVKDNTIATLLSTLLEENGVKGTVVDNENVRYEYSAGKIGGMSLYFGVKENAFYLTTDATLYATLLQANENPLSDAPIAAQLKKAYSGAIINVDEIMNLQIVKTMAGLLVGNTITSAVSEFSYIEAINETKETATVNIYMTNKTDNSLKTLYGIYNRLAGEK